VAKKITRPEFFRVCEALREMKEQFIASRATEQEAADVLAEATGLPVSRNMISEAKLATGINWPKRASAPPVSWGRRIAQLEKDVAVLTEQVIVLTNKLRNSHSATIPDALEEMHTRPKKCGESNGE